MDTKFGCHPPMSTNGVEVPVEESNNENDTSELQKKTAYLNFFPKSCYENIQFKLSKEGHIEPEIVTSASAAVSVDKTVEVDVNNTHQPTNSPPSTDQSPSDTTTASRPSTTDATSNRLSSVSVTTSVFSNEVPVSKSASVVVEASTMASSPELVAGQVTISTAKTDTMTTTVHTSLSSDNTDGPVSTSDNRDETKVNSAVIEVGDINPVYQRWEILKKKNSSSNETNNSDPVDIVTTNSKEVPNAGASTMAPSPYDLMEPILKPSTCNSTIFLSATSSVVDNQISDVAQSIAPSDTLYENVVHVGDRKFKVTPPSSCDSRESLNFPLESSPSEQHLDRSNSIGSLPLRPTVQQQATFYSPANNRKDVLKHSVSLSTTNTTPQAVKHKPLDEISKSVILPATDVTSINNSKVHIRGSTAISKGTVKKKINLFENNTMPPGNKSLAEMGIIEDKDSDNGFIV